tara:strand:- start:932 stop:1387 length:456 start_codon:yes stop_codon:yes gene_type:complete
MELEFKTTLNESRDIDLFDFDTMIDKEFDYINNIEVNIDWKAVIYTKSYGIVNNWPIVEGFTFEINYQLLEDEEMEKITDEDKDYEFKLGPLDFLNGPLGTMEKAERDRLPYKDKKWVIKNSYSSREDNETHLFITGVEIDFESKEINVIF